MFYHDTHTVPEFVRFEAGKLLEQYIDITDNRYSYCSESIILEGFYVLVQEGYLTSKQIARELSLRTNILVPTNMVEEWLEQAKSQYGVTKTI